MVGLVKLNLIISHSRVYQGSFDNSYSKRIVQNTYLYLLCKNNVISYIISAAIRLLLRLPFHVSQFFIFCSSGKSYNVSMQSTGKAVVSWLCEKMHEVRFRFFSSLPSFFVSLSGDVAFDTVFSLFLFKGRAGKTLRDSVAFPKMENSKW